MAYKKNDIRHARHCVFLMHVHLVFLKKYRRDVFTQAILSDLHIIFTSLCKDFESELIEFNGEDDHLIRKKNHPTIRKKLWGGALWSPSYFSASCGGAPIDSIGR